MDKNSMTLEFRVNKQHLDRVDRQKVVEKSENYLYAHFTFSSDWVGLKKYMLARPLTSQDTSNDYKIELDESGRCKIPYDLNFFPGFVISAYGETKNDDSTNTIVVTDSVGLDEHLDIMSNVVITTDAQAVDISNATITGGELELPIRYVTSNNHTIIINKTWDLVDIGIETEFEYDKDTYTLYLYAITYDENQEKVRTLLSSIELAECIDNITTELEYEDPETHEISYRNLVFTYADGTVKRVTLDYFWDEIRQDLQTAVTNLNLRIDSEVETLNNTINALDERLTNAINKEIQDRIDDVNAEEARAISVENDLQTQIVVEQQRAMSAEEELANALEQEATTRAQEDTSIRNDLQDEKDRATTQEVILDAKIEGLRDDLNYESNRLETLIDQETQRAQGVEQNIVDSIGTTQDTSSANTVYGHLKAEEERAQNAEQGIRTSIGTQSDDTTATVYGYVNVQDNALAQAIRDEASAREQADNELSSAIQEEQDRATAQEVILDTKIEGLSDNLDENVLDLNTKITNETNRATQAEGALGTRIDNLDLSEVGSDGNYIKLVSQSNGQVSASTGAFDTEIPEPDSSTQPSQITAPTTKAVRDYVDTFGGKIDTITINGSQEPLPIVDKNVDITIPTQTSDLTNDGDGTNPFITNATAQITESQVTNLVTDLASKVSKVDSATTYTQAYTKDTSGNQTMTNVSDSVVNSAIPQRDSNGQINVPNTPTQNSHATSKKYVDDTFGKIDTASIDGAPLTVTNKNLEIPTVRTDINNQNLTSNQKEYAKTNLDLNNVVNTGDSATPLENGTTKFTTGGAYTLQQSLQTNINNVDDKLNVNVHIEGNSDEITYNGDTVTKTSPYKNLKTGGTGSREEVIHLANSTTAGLMSFTDYNTIQDNKRRIDALEGTPVRLIYTASQNPTASDIKSFVDTYLAGKGVTTPTDSDYNSVSVKINGTNHIWNYYANDGAYKDDGLDTVTQFTNSIAGIIKGKQNDGFVYAESDGTGSVYGWSTLTSRVTNVENNKVDNSTLGTQSDTGTSTVYGYVNTQVADLQNQINDEATARTNKDNDLQNQIDDEVTRALASEAVLEGDIDEYSFKNVSSQDITSLVASAKNNVWTNN